MRELNDWRKKLPTYARERKKVEARGKCSEDRPKEPKKQKTLDEFEEETEDLK